MLIPASVAGLDQRVGGLDQRVGSLDQRVGGLDQRVGGLDQHEPKQEGVRVVVEYRLFGLIRPVVSTLEFLWPHSFEGGILMICSE